MRLRAWRPPTLRRHRDENSRQGAFELWRALPRARPYLRPYRRILGLSMVAMVLAAVFALAEPWPIALVFNSALGDKEPPSIVQFFLGKNPGLGAMLVFLMVTRFGIVAIGHGFVAVRNYLDAKAEQHMVLDLRSDLFDHAQQLSLTFHDRRQTGQLMNQINNQASALGNIVMAFPPIIESLLMLGGMITIAVLIDWQVTLAGLSVIPLLYLSFVLYGRKIVPRLQRVQRLEWRSLSIVHEAMSMLRVIVSFGRERYEHRKFREQGEVAVDERVKLTFGQSLYTLGVQSATAFGTSIVIGFGAWHVAQGKMPVGGLIVLMSYTASIYQPLEQISATVGSLHEQFVRFNASLRLLEIEPEIKEAPDAVDMDARGEVSIDNVGFSYPGRRDTLRDISLSARAGESVAVVGETGAGKTTLMNLLIRFYDPQQGRILIDGIDIRRLKLRSLRRQISVVLQEPMLFSGTIAENIRYGKLDASTEEIIEAARGANAHDFITRLPDGYETVLGERGAQLSGGERQRICVARAFLKDAPILILDEPTSSIDSKTEAVVLDALDDLMVGRTSFMVAHRLSTVRHADQIVVLHQGRIVEVGTHEELLELRGFYHQFHEAQSRERRRRTATLRRRGNGAPVPSHPAGRTREEYEPAEPSMEVGAVEPFDDAIAATAMKPEASTEPRMSQRDSGRVSWHEVQPPAPEPRIDINSADVSELERLPGVGRLAAERIVSERQTNGPFRSVTDLERVDGFDERRVRRLSEQVRV